MNILKAVSAAILLIATLGAAEAAVVSGNFNQNGYDVIDLHVAADAVVDFNFLSGYGDPTFSLFNASGNHLITNDDTNGLYAHLTRQLSAGNYSFVVSACCNFVNHLPGASFASTDGFNNGSYWIGGSATLSSFTAGFTQGSGAGAAYEFAIQNAVVGSADVPEPGSLALFGASIAALAMARRRKQLRA